MEVIAVLVVAEEVFATPTRRASAPEDLLADSLIRKYFSPLLR